MRTIATIDAGYSPVLRDTVTAGREYDLPDTDPLPSFLEEDPATPPDTPQGQAGSTWDYTDTSDSPTEP